MTPEWETAAKTGDSGAIRTLLEKGADPNVRNSDNQTALMLVAHAGHFEPTSLLLRAGADLDATAKFGLSATMLAVVAGHEDIALLLARAGADLSVQGTGAPGFAGKTASDLAREKGFARLADELDPTRP